MIDCWMSNIESHGKVDVTQTRIHWTLFKCPLLSDGMSRGLWLVNNLSHSVCKELVVLLHHIGNESLWFMPNPPFVTQTSITTLWKKLLLCVLNEVTPLYLYKHRVCFNHQWISGHLSRACCHNMHINNDIPAPYVSDHLSNLFHDCLSWGGCSILSIDLNIRRNHNHCSGSCTHWQGQYRYQMDIHEHQKFAWIYKQGNVSPINNTEVAVLINTWHLVGLFIEGWDM